MKKINPSLAQVLRALGVRKFNDVQKAAESHGLFSKDEHYALVSQSRTGKSFTGGVFVANELFKHCKHRITSNEDIEDNELAIFVAPFHASARETSTMLSKYFGWFIRPFLMIGEIHAAEAVLRIAKGDSSPNVIIATPGAMMDFLRVDETRKWLESRNVVAVVYDDVHSILHDPNRGMSLMELSAYFTQVEPRPRTLVLSAQFDEPSRLESLFNVKLIEDKTMYTAPDINLVKYKTTKEKSTRLAEMLLELAEDGIRTLVYMKSIGNMKKLLEVEGVKLAETVSIDVEAMVRERLQRIGGILKDLEYPEASLIGSGIGFYHGQMDKAQRWFVEWAFRRGYLRFLFGTEALAYGVNTPVEEVVMGAPGIDEIFRQSMMARAVRLRRGKGRAGTCTVFTKTISDVEALERVYYHPKLPLRFAAEAQISNLIMGLMGLGLLNNEDDRSKMSDNIGLFFKRGSTKRTLKALMSAEVPLVVKDNGTYKLSDTGRVAFNSTISGYQALRLLEGISILEKSKKPPTDFDLLLLMNYAALLAGRQAAKKELDQNLQDFLEKKTDSILLKHILDTEHEPKWKQAIEYTTLIYTSIRDDLDFESPTRKTVARLLLELHRFVMNFIVFMQGLKEIGSKEQKKLLENLLKLMENDPLEKLFPSLEKSRKRSLKWQDLSFIDFGEIEKSIDAILTSGISPVQKIQLIGLLESVESTTSAFVDLMERYKDDDEAREALDTVCMFSSEGLVGSNLVEALEEAEVLQRGTADHLWTRFTARLDEIKKKTDAPSKAVSVLTSLFTGDIVGAATGGLDVLRTASGRTKVDTSGMSDTA